MRNTIHNLDTKLFENASGEFCAIVMGLDIGDASDTAFFDHVVAQFLDRRMCSPPETANMTVTIAGEMTAADFRARWSEHVARNDILRTFMTMMVVADVLHIRGRELLDRASLIANAG